ncbi:kanamycin biosynthetic protein [Mycobacterium sp. WY10]|nr:kanamycin biosynthetic protein [Mycobacterium sp. WY10]
MGFLDKALGKTKEVLGSNADKVEQAIDKAGDIIDQKTQGKYSSTVDKVQDAAKNYVDSNRTDKGEQPN